MAMKKVRKRPPQSNAKAVEISAKSAKVQMDTARRRLEQSSSHDSEYNGDDEGESVAVTNSTDESCEEAVKYRCPFGIHRFSLQPRAGNV